MTPRKFFALVETHLQVEQLRLGNTEVQTEDVATDACIDQIPGW